MTAQRLWLVVALLAGSSRVGAACLLSDYSVNAEYQRSAWVVVADAQSQEAISENEAMRELGGVQYTLKVIEVLKGATISTISVFSENSSGRFPLEIGKRYLLFLHEQQGRLSADYCGNSGLASTKQAVIAELRGVKKATNAGQKPNYALSPSHSAVTALAQGGKRRAVGRARYRER